MTDKNRPLAREEINKINAETELALGKAAQTSVEREIKHVELRNKEEAESIKNHGDFRSGYFEFTSSVSSSSVDYLLQSLRRFSRLYPGKDIEIEIQSPGGSIIDGFRLIDELRRIKKRGGHYVTMVARGNIASMAVPIFQAADHRIVGPSCFVMIHRAAFGAMGKAYEIEDQVEFVQRIESRIVDILVERGHRDREYYPDLFKQRKDVWFSAEEAVELGLADEIA